MINIKSVIRIKHFKLLRAQLKGAEKLRKKNAPFFVEKIFNDLANVPLDLTLKDFPISLVGAHGVHAESQLRQNLLRKRRSICSAIMQSIGSGKAVKLPVPDSWVCSLESKGIRVNRGGCKRSLYKYSVISVLKGIVKTILLLIRYKLPTLTGNPYIVFIDLASNNLPVSGQKKSYDIISWYKKSCIKKPGIEEIWAQVRTPNIYHVSSDIYFYKYIFPHFTKCLNYLQYFSKSCISLAVTIAGIIQFKWWYGILHQESVFLNYISILDDQDVAREYLFSNSNWLHKPLWSFEAEMKGSEVKLYYYSTNMDRFQWRHRREDSDIIKTMQWRNFIVWDKQQRDLLKRYCSEADYQVVGSIDFVDSYTKFKSCGSEFKIAIFDVTPSRPVFYTSFGWAIAPYYSDNLSMQFFKDIREIGEESQVILFWKQKRILDRSRVDKGYIKKRELIINKYFSEVGPDVSARRLIEESNAVISMPFTSTAIIGKELGKPSIYYDASGSIVKKNSHSIPVLKNKDELKIWFNSMNIENV